MNKAEKEFCENCHIHKDCGWVKRGLESDCEEVDRFSYGYEVAVEKACEYLKRTYEDIGIRWMRGYEADDLIEAFKQAMMEE